MSGGFSINEIEIFLSQRLIDRLGEPVIIHFLDYIQCTPPLHEMILFMRAVDEENITIQNRTGIPFKIPINSIKLITFIKCQHVLIE